MQFPVKLVVGCVAASVAGIVTAHMAMGTRVAPAATDDPSWQVWQSPEGGDDPYLVARFLMAGRLPPPRGPAQEFEAAADKDGRPFAGSCLYRITLKTDDWRWWSVEVPGGGTVTSTTAIAEADGSVRIALSPTVQPGNWLTTPSSSGFRILMHVLPTADAVTPRSPERLSCA